MLKKLWDIWWLKFKWPLKLISGVAVILLVLLPFLWLRGCGKPSAKIDLETVDKINSKNAAEAKKEVREVVEENLTVTTTVDNRTTLAEANAVERDRLIEEKIKEVDKKITEAKQ